jgi:uncharacterized DUF497 family protein
MSIKVTFDAAKRDLALRERGLDFARASEVFAGPQYTRIDDRHFYGEDRYITFGLLDRRVVVVVWTPRDDTYRIISMRKANDREKAYFRERMG